MSMSYGPDTFSVPTGPDAAWIPGDVVKLLDSVRESLIGHASSVADRSVKYATAPTADSPNSVQAPAGTVVISTQLRSIWVKTSSTADNWMDFFVCQPQVLLSGSGTCPKDKVTAMAHQTIPEDGVYAITGWFQQDSSATNQPTENYSGYVMDYYVSVNDSSSAMGVGENYVTGSSIPAAPWVTYGGSRTMSLAKGDNIYLKITQHESFTNYFNWQLSYQRIA